MKIFNNDIFSLEEITFVAGDYTVIDFTVYNKTKEELADLDGYIVKCVISPLGNPNSVILDKIGTLIEEGKYRIELNSNETINLSGKYSYQPLLILNETHQYRPAQGILTIVPANKN